GEVRCEGDLTIGKEGYVERAVSARNLFLAGELKGTAKIDNKIHIFDSGKLEGTVEMTTIVIDENGHLQGKSIMKGSNKSNSNVIEIEKEKINEKTKEIDKDKHKQYSKDSIN
ncbi:polymer-forming cytoskeletal protein, partial [Pseudomonas sp. 2822-17]|uniref:bactofilin family protein n=1 Tax=Pseudomonas sp. 2822-17 TaxID=1712678 RepID=UPI00117B4211